MPHKQKVKNGASLKINNFWNLKLHKNRDVYIKQVVLILPFPLSTTIPITINTYFLFCRRKITKVQSHGRMQRKTFRKPVRHIERQSCSIPHSIRINAPRGIRNFTHAIQAQAISKRNGPYAAESVAAFTSCGMHSKIAQIFILLNIIFLLTLFHSFCLQYNLQIIPFATENAIDAILEFCVITLSNPVRSRFHFV